MGKYQLDSKGKAQEQKFHEKNSTEGGRGINTRNATLAKVEALRAKKAEKEAKKEVRKK